MSYLFIGTILAHRTYGYMKLHNNEKTLKPYIPTTEDKIVNELTNSNYDSSNITFHNMNINRYYDQDKCIGCIDDYSNGITKNEPMVDIKGQNITCKRIINTRYYDNEVEIATITVGYNTGEILQFSVSPYIHNKYCLCELIIKTLYIHPECKKITMSKGENAMSEYLEYRGNKINYGPIIYYELSI